MKLKQMIRGVVLAIVAASALLSSTTIWANSRALEEMCVFSNGKCVSNGCSANGGVCGMPELPQVKNGKAVDRCWCLF